MEFEEFIKIGGCREGKHLFGGNSVAQYRIEWFQSVGSVTVCVYCKNVSPKEVSMVFGEQTFSLNFKTEDGDIATVDKELFQPIDTQNSTYNVFRTKIEVVLKKTNGISWPSLEPTTEIKTWTTFGVQGKTGSVGSMNAQVAGDSPLFTATK